MLVRTARLVPETIRSRPREFAKKRLRAVRRVLGLSPIQQVFKEVHRRGFDVGRCRTLEVFGGDGSLHTKDYAARVDSLEIWEVEPALALALQQSFPRAIVKTVDAHREVSRVQGGYDLVIVDNPERAFGPYCEHFDLFPSLLPLLSDSSVMILDVIPRLDDSSREKWPHVFDPAFNDIERHLARRRDFYHTDDPTHIGIDTMVAAYRDQTRAHGFALEWHFAQPRPVLADYLVLKLARLTPATFG